MPTQEGLIEIEGAVNVGGLEENVPDNFPLAGIITCGNCNEETNLTSEQIQILKEFVDTIDTENIDLKIRHRCEYCNEVVWTYTVWNNG